jgi:putative glutamine amidotransferase
MTRPRLAISAGFGLRRSLPTTQLNLDYTGAIEEAGGLPLVVAVPYQVRRPGRAEAEVAAACLAAEVLSVVDGVLVSGGGDIDPGHFGQAPVPELGEIEPARDLFEIALVREARFRGMPVMGVCRGLQVLAVVAGGSLYQDLPSQREGVLAHRQAEARPVPSHLVDVRPETYLAGRLGPGPIKVNSFHHQGVCRVPEGFIVSATAPDGVIEAIENAEAATTQDGLAFGLQWHPENLFERDPIFLALFAGLVEAADRRRGR